MANDPIPEPAPSSTENDWANLAIGFVAISTIALTLIFVGYINSAEDRDITKLGPVGDWFGGMLNPLIAFLALTGLVKSVVIQQKTLRTTTEGLERQLRVQRRQLSKQTFFDLLRLRGEAVDSIEWNDQGKPLHGRAAVKGILKTLETAAAGVSPADIEAELKYWRVPNECSANVQPYVALFAAFYSNHPGSYVTSWYQLVLFEAEKLANLEAELGHVFRATYQTLKFVYECSDFDRSEKRDLANYLRAQMSEGEFALFALTAATSIGEKSRAISIAFDLYEDRLYSITWARELVELFDPKLSHNAAFAAKYGFPVLQRE